MRIDRTRGGLGLLVLVFMVFANPVAAQDKLIKEILEEGNGASAKTGDQVLIHEETRYRDGTLIFSSY